MRTLPFLTLTALFGCGGVPFSTAPDAFDHVDGGDSGDAAAHADSQSWGVDASSKEAGWEGAPGVPAEAAPLDTPDAASAADAPAAGDDASADDAPADAPSPPDAPTDALPDAPPALCCVNASTPSIPFGTCPAQSPACGSDVYCSPSGVGWNCWAHPAGQSDCTQVNCCSGFVGVCPQ